MLALPHLFDLKRPFLAAAVFAALVMSAPINGQFPPQRPGDVPIRPGTSGPMPGNKQLDRNQRPDPDGRDPIITLRITPAEAARGERMTLNWEVRDARPNVAWNAAVTLSSAADLNPPLPNRPALRGEHTFNAPARSGAITLETAGRTKRVSFTVTPPPELTSISPERVKAGERITLSGHHFGRVQGQSRVEPVDANQNVRLALESWADERIVVRVPANAPAGELRLRVSVGSAHVNTRAQTVQVFRTLTVTDAMVRAMSSTVGLDQTRVRLDSGPNNSTVRFSDYLHRQGVEDLAFTTPDKDAMKLGVKVTYRVANMNSTSVTVGIADGKLELGVAFESNGVELRGSGIAPNVQLNHAKIDIKLTPGVANNRLAFTDATARFSADIHVDADWLDALVNAITNPDGAVRSGIERGIRDAVNRQAFRNTLATALTTALSEARINRIISVTPAGNSITIEYE